jgi:MarR family transcriptional regulator for hemolysin
MSEFKLEETLMYAIGKTGKKIILRLNKRMQHVGSDLTMHQMGLLHYLSIKGEAIQQELAEITDTDKSAVLRTIDILERKGFVKRVPDTSDRRKNKVETTEKSLAVIQIMNRLVQEEMHSILDGVTEEEIALCMKVLNRIQANCGPACENS